MDKEGVGLEITELRLGLPGGRGGGDLNNSEGKNEKKRGFSELAGEDENSSTDDRKIQKKNQVVGWPPVCSYRRKNSFGEKDHGSKMYVKVSMDGAPFLRKLDLATHTAYSDLASALEKLFNSFEIGMTREYDKKIILDLFFKPDLNSTKYGKVLREAELSEYVLIYEDKDGDWMLVGDVPWEMFVVSCKRLRIMKRSEAKGFGLSTKEFINTIDQKDEDI